MDIVSCVSVSCVSVVMRIKESEECVRNEYMSSSPETEPTVAEEKKEEDVKMDETEEEKKARAVRQGASPSLALSARMGHVQLKPVLLPSCSSRVLLCRFEPAV